jgi:plastocyanin
MTGIYLKSITDTIMKKTTQAAIALLVLGFTACKKSSQSQITLTPSTTEATVGQTVSVTLSADANASSWTVSPSSTASKTFGVTTSKVNYFTFTQPGVYTISVRAKTIAYDSAANQSLDSCWAHSGAARGGCTPGVDTASVGITVTGK